MLVRLTLPLLFVALLWPIAAKGQRINFTNENGEYPVGLAPIAVAAGDLDGDGRADLAVANTDDDDVSILIGTEDGGFIDTAIRFPVGQAPFAIVIADVSGDGNNDIIVTCDTEDAVSVLINEGGGFFAERRFDTGSSPEGLVVRDFDGDGRLDIATANNFEETVQILRGTGDGNFSMGQTIVVGASPVGLSAGDIDGDQRLDLVVSNTAGGDDANGSLTFLKGNGNGTFSLQPEFILPDDCGGIGCSPIRTEVADFNGDSRLDLAVINFDGDSVSIFLGNGDFTFQATTVIEVSGNPEGSVLADFDGDGNLDIATTGGFDDLVSISLGFGNGMFDEPLEFQVFGAYPTGIAAGDFNSDGRPDFVVANLDEDTIEVFLSVPVCGGDCDGDSIIDRADLISLINLALDQGGGMMCSNGDTDSSGGITVEEIVGAVKNAAAGGCI